jgi:hypothetical protein
VFTLSDCSFSGDVIGDTVVGGICGTCGGLGSTMTIDRCLSEGAVTALDGSAGGLVAITNAPIRDSGSHSTVVGTTIVGGLVGGYSDGDLRTTYATVERSFATGDVFGESNVGGLIGSALFVRVFDSYALGDVDGATQRVGGLMGWIVEGGELDRSYSAGAVTGTATSMGGFLGASYIPPSFDSAYWDTESSGLSISEGGEGRTSAEMVTQSTFVDWDFTASSGVWKITEGVSYPCLQWEEGDCPPACDPGSGGASACAAPSCKSILDDGYSDGDGRYWIDPEADGSDPFEVYCVMDDSYDGGGWALTSVHSDDSQHTWTKNNGHFDTDTITTFGSFDELHMDYKSRALHEAPMADVLYIHQPSGVWASYNDVQDGSGDFGSLVASIDEEICYGASDGFLMTAGTLTTTLDMCSTQLFINAADQDGSSVCTSSASVQDSHGPTWSVRQNGGCPFDDPSKSGGLGPALHIELRDVEDSWGDAPQPVGFGRGLYLNTGTEGAAENYMWMLVR